MKNALLWLKGRLSEGATWASLGTAITATMAVRDQVGAYMPLVIGCVVMGVLLKDKAQ